MRRCRTPRSGLLMSAVAHLLAAGCALTPLAVGAQFVRGTVSEQVGGVGVGGVVLELLDSAAARVSSTLTTDRGAFLMRVPRPGAYRIAARRIGFRQRTLGPFDLAGDTAITLVLEQIPQVMPAVTAMERLTCAELAGDATATGVLWESANTALIASAVAMREGAYEFELARHRREYALAPTVLTSLRTEFARLRDVRPWTSLPAEVLARHGFVHMARDRSLTYVAPDLELLTSPAFATTHCFTVREDSARPALMGLEFQPRPDVRRADVRGTLWLTRSALELQALEFAFTGLQFTGPDTLAGGRLGFARLANGAFVPTDWLIRSPIPPGSFLDALERRDARERPRDATGDEPIAIPHTAPSWHSNRVIITGGTVLAVRQATDSLALWLREPGEVHATVRWRRGDRAAAAGVRVLLVGLDARAHTDQQGRVTFRDVPPGEYVVATTSDEEEFLRLPRDERVARVVSGAATAVTLTALPPQAAVNAVCEFNRDDAVLAGIASLDGQGTTGARIRVDVVNRDAAGRERATALRTGWSGDAGLYHVCRVPRGGTYVVSALFPAGVVAQQRITIPLSQPGIVSPVLVRLDLGAGTP